MQTVIELRWNRGERECGYSPSDFALCAPDKYSYLLTYLLTYLYSYEAVIVWRSKLLIYFVSVHPLALFRTENIIMQLIRLFSVLHNKFSLI